MVTLVVATTTDPASINPENDVFAMSGWLPGQSFQEDTKSLVNEGVSVLLHGKSIVVEDDLDKWWEELTGVVVDEVIFLCKHATVSNKHALTIHPIDYFGGYTSWPVTNKPTLFIETGSTEDYWKRQDAAQGQ